MNAQWKLESSLHSLVISGIDLIMKQDYDQADSLFRSVASRYPHNPAGYLYQAAVMQAYSFDFMVPLKHSTFDSLLEIGRQTAKNLDSPWREYFLATADGYEASERADRGDWFGGVRKGLSSASQFEEVIEKDSSFYDAYVGIGTYYYWRSRKMYFLSWLPFVHDDREQGIQLLKESAERAVYNHFAAISSLVSILIDAENYKELLEWSQRGLAYYPENRTFLWGLVTALDQQGQKREAVDTYEHLLGNLITSSAPHPYDQIVCRLNLAQCQLYLKDTTRASSNLRALMQFEGADFPQQLKDRAQAKFTRARELLAQLNDKKRR